MISPELAATPLLLVDPQAPRRFHIIQLMPLWWLFFLRYLSPWYPPLAWCDYFGYFIFIPDLCLLSQGKWRQVLYGWRVLLLDLVSVLCNPFMLVEVTWQSLSELGTFCRMGWRLMTGRRTEHLLATKSCVCQLPCTGRWLVVNGGVHPETSHSWGVMNQRYAYDLVMTDEQGCTHRHEGKQNTDYYAFGQPIVALADGVVVRCRNDVRDGTKLQSKSIWLRSIFGNYVMIEHAPGVVSVTGHLQRGSVAVAAGQVVRGGELIGKCGNSGNSTEPHIHFQLQDSRYVFCGIGLPILFSDVLVSTTADPERPAHHLPRGYLTKDHYVENADGAALTQKTPQTTAGPSC